MGASSSHSLRRAWLWPALLAGVICVLVVLSGQAPVKAGSGAGSNSVFMPYVSLPRAPQIELTPFAVGFDNITIMDITNAGDERLFVAGREGKVWIVYPDGTVDPTLFLDVTNLVQHEVNFEQGLLGLAFHPDFPNTPYFYFTYTSPGHIYLTRGTVDPAHPNVADPRSLRSMMRIAKPPASGGPSPVHNAGDLTFGPDGYLYIPVGDGGPDPYDPLGVPGDPFNNAQRRDTMLGSILRIDVDPTRGLPQDCGLTNLYSIPPSNPWIGDNGCDEIWAVGLRNPWRINFDALNGDLYIADVGEWQREEVNYLPGGTPGGANFGWHCYEGNVNYAAQHPEIASTCNANTQYVFPVHEYNHSQGECSIIGGLVYRGEAYPSLYGRYFFGDWCSGRLWTMARLGNRWQVDPAGRTVVMYSTFGTDIHGELYGGGYANGTLYKLVVR